MQHPIRKKNNINNPGNLQNLQEFRANSVCWILVFELREGETKSVSNQGGINYPKIFPAATFLPQNLDKTIESTKR